MEMSNVTNSNPATLFACQENEVMIDNDIGGASVVYNFLDPSTSSVLFIFLPFKMDRALSCFVRC